VARSQPRGTARETLRSSSAALASNPRRALLLLGAFASFLISALFTVDLFTAGPAGLGGRLPVVGDISDRSYKAQFDVTLVDEAATEEQRRAALEHAPVVYDHDERASGDLRERVRSAFAAGREAQAAEPDESASSPDPTVAFRESLGASGDLPGAAVDRIAASKFDLRQQGSVIRLLEPLVSRMVVADPAELEKHGDKRIVVVRELGSGEERKLPEKAQVLDTGGARKIVAEGSARVLEGLARADRRALLELAQVLVRPNLSFNLRATDERRQAIKEGVQEVTLSLRKGEIIVRDGEPLTDRHLMVLRGVQEQVRTRNQAEAFISVWGLVLLLFWATWHFGSTGIESFPTSFKDANFLLLMLVLMALGTRLTLFICDAVAGNPEFAAMLEHAPVQLYYVVPFAAATMLVRMVHSAETAALFAVLSSLLVGLQLGGDVNFAFYVLVGSLFAAVGSAAVTQRATLLRTGAWVGAANMGTIFALELLEGDLRLAPLGIELTAGFVSGCLAGGLVIAFAPVVESVFQYTTDIRLLELANRERELLRELELRAPGTYHHSMMVGHLAEKAAEAIGANALLAKVAGYYHDIGKMRRPHFFVENVTIHRGENRHEKISPSMSARIIQAHVRDGLDLGRGHKLSSPIMRGIGEHHGTSIIRFFYEKAKEQLDPEKGEQVQEHEYRYAGPKPQTRESGILMLADSVEAASRTLADPSPARVQQLVQRITNNYFRDGQLDECSLTLRDLHLIARSFIDTLSAIRHERIDYPEATDSEGRPLEEGADEGVVERLEPRDKDRQESPEEGRGDDIRRLGLP
jgi:putative nucleotidyltransferase with HDIG domain